MTDLSRQALAAYEAIDAYTSVAEALHDQAKASAFDRSLTLAVAAAIEQSVKQTRRVADMVPQLVIQIDEIDRACSVARERTLDAERDKQEIQHVIRELLATNLVVHEHAEGKYVDECIWCRLTDIARPGWIGARSE